MFFVFPLTLNYEMDNKKNISCPFRNSKSLVIFFSFGKIRLVARPVRLHGRGVSVSGLALFNQVR